MEQSRKSGSLFNSESEDKESFSSETPEKIKEPKEVPENNVQQKQENNNNINSYSYNNQIELKYITELSENTISLNLEKILNQDSLTNLMKNIFHRILKTNSIDQSYNDMHKYLLQKKNKIL